MAKYKIELKALEEGKEAKEFDKTYEEGIECDGFVILGVNEGGHYSAIHDMDVVKIAKAIACDNKVLPASIIAKAIYESKGLSEKMARNSLLELLKGIGAE